MKLVEAKKALAPVVSAPPNMSTPVLTLGCDDALVCKVPSSLLGAASAIDLGLGTASLTARCLRNEVSEAGSDSSHDSDDDSDDDSGDDSEDDSDLDDNYLTQFESSLCATPVPVQVSPEVPLPSKNAPDFAYPPAPLTHLVSHDCPLPDAVDITNAHAVANVLSGIGSNVGCFDAMGQPNEKASICFQCPISAPAQKFDYESDLCIAARLAAVVDEFVAPFDLTETISKPKQPSVFVDLWGKADVATRVVKPIIRG